MSGKTIPRAKGDPKDLPQPKTGLTEPQPKKKCRCESCENCPRRDAEIVPVKT